MKKIEYQLHNVTPHDTTVGNKAENFTLEADQRSVLRAQENYRELGTIQTDIGPIDMHEADFGELTPESRQNFERFKRTLDLGKGTAHLLVGSPFTVFGAKLSGIDVNPMQSDISMGWPAMIQRSGRNAPTGARRIGVLPVNPSSPHPRLDHDKIAEYRKELFNSEVEVVNRSPDPLTFKRKKVTLGNVIEPYYQTQEIGIGKPGNVEVARERLSAIYEVPRIESGTLTIVHSRALLALMLSPQSNINDRKAASIAMPYTPRDKKTGQKTNAIGAVAVYSPATLRRYAQIL